MEYTPHLPYNPQYSETLKNQEKIGWIQSLMGLTVYNWSEIQNLHLQSLGVKTTEKRWMSSLIRKF